MNAKKREKSMLKFRLQRGRFGIRSYVPREKFRDCWWIFTIGDADDKPSVPHAHSKGEGYRLNAWNGEIYPAGNDRSTVINKLNRKELQRLHKDKKFIDFAVKQINWYRSEYPCISFFVPEWFRLAHMMKQVDLQKYDDVSDIYIFKSKVYNYSDESPLAINRKRKMNKM